MKKANLTASVVAELNTLAKKKKMALPVKAKKAKKAKTAKSPLAAVAPGKKPAKKAASLKKAAPQKPAAKKIAVKKAAVTKAIGKKTAVKQAVAKNLVVKKAVVKKAVVKKTAPAGKTGKSAKPAAKKLLSAVKSRTAISSVREWKLPPGAEEPLMAQERVAESKYYTGPKPMMPVADTGELPRGYNEETISILSRDPYIAYAFWEATPARIEREKTWFGWDSKLCVRIYDITGVQFDGRNAIGYFDQEVVDRVGSWYFDFGRPTHSFCADLGLMSPEGRFLTIARSEYITMPRDGISDVIDEEWMLADEEFWQLYGYPEGFRQGVSSPEMQEMLKRRRALEISSPGLVSRDRIKRK